MGSQHAIYSFRIQIVPAWYNISNNIWVEENTDIGNVTSYTPAEPLEIGAQYSWRLVPYNNVKPKIVKRGIISYGCSKGELFTGVVTDEVTDLPIENVEIFIEQLSGNYNTTIIYKR